ncbi:MAG TPA: hypothetical protein VF587_17650 [Solirubrobacteraceae bacterium]|jgi:hypothetical protein
MARFAALLCVLALFAPGAAFAQGGGAFDPIPPAPPEQPAPAEAPEEEDDDGLNSTQQLLIALSGFVLLFGIGWAIVRDARGAAPVESRRGPASDGEGPRPKGSRTPAGVRHRTNRAKAKAARQARKKSRKR